MDFYNNLSSSEQRLIKWGLLIISCALFWVWVYKPIDQSLLNKNNTLASLETQLKSMQESKEELLQRASKPMVQRASNQPFITWIDQQLNARGLAESLTRSEPQNNSVLTLTFENVAFDQLIDWIQSLITDHSIHLSEADFTIVDRENGGVNSRLTLEEK